MNIVSAMGSGYSTRELDLSVLLIGEVVGDSFEVNFTGDGIVTLRLDENSPTFTVYRMSTF